MKLAIVRQSYTPFGGAERFVAGALAALRAENTAVDIIARRWEEDTRGVRCDPYYLGRTWRDAGFARCVQNIIASGRYDLVQSHERIPGCHVFRAGDGVHATWVELGNKRFWRLSPWHRYTLAAERAMFNHPDLRAVICNSRMVRDDIARRFPVAADKLRVIYSGVDTELFHPGLRATHRDALRKSLGVDARRPVILFVGSGYARKGVATLLEALGRMRQRDAEAWIVGQDKEQPRYEKHARRLGLSSRVRFCGAQADVRPYYAAADVFCLPTLYDPLPNATLEALACGLPVVTTTTCGAAELIEPGVTGSLCAPRDPVALADRLDELCPAGTAATMGEAAAGSIAHLTPRAMAESMLALYRTCLHC